MTMTENSYRRQRVYVAGPMRGEPQHNFPAFNQAAALFRAAGFVAVNPVEVGLMFGNDPAVSGADYVREDLLHVCRCDAIAILPRWERSVGARCEVAVALTLGLDFFDATNGHRIAPPARSIVTGGYEQQPGAVDLLDTLRAEVISWANATFTLANPHSKAAHLEREAKELRAAPRDVEEMADVFILLCHLSDGHDLAAAVRAKLEKNKLRAWGEPDAEGVVEHVAALVATPSAAGTAEK